MELPTRYEQCTDSISCLHALEHFGWGRYGDPVDYSGYLKGFNNITRMLKPGGTFYFSVPLGLQRIEFHAHRVFSMKYLLEMVSSDFDITAFSYIDDHNEFHENAAITPEAVGNNFGCRYGCAIFELTKK
jgi:SAM-dependent methyltransferase